MNEKMVNKAVRPRPPVFTSPRSAHGRRHRVSLLAFVGSLFLLAPFVTAQAQYEAHITQIDKQSFPDIRVYVSITDASGNSIPDNLPVELSLYEGDELVSHKVLSAGWEVSSVLALDVSGSMKDVSKIDKAKEAAIRYVEMLPPDHQVEEVDSFNAEGVIS